MIVCPPPTIGPQTACEHETNQPALAFSAHGHLVSGKQLFAGVIDCSRLQWLLSSFTVDIKLPLVESLYITYKHSQDKLKRR